MSGVFHIRRLLAYASLGALLGLVARWVGQEVFDSSYSTVVLDQHSRVLSCEIAKDQQWRFAPANGVPDKLRTCIRMFEDEYFNWHVGVNPIALGRALQQNIASGSVVSGGSTISMQVARMSMKHERRTILAKLSEMAYAMCIEAAHSKDSILQMWADNAPFGGNIVGFQAASYAYFRRPPKELSWAEAALLAVLPNQPSMMYPGRNQQPLQRKRDRLLLKLFNADLIDKPTFELSKLEALPSGITAFPQRVPHVLVRAKKDGLTGSTVVTTIDASLQQQVQHTVDVYASFLRNNDVHNSAVLINHVPTGRVVAYVGNSRIANTENASVDMISAARSSGSILKPLLHAKRIDHDMLPFQLLPDYPMSFAGFRPRNYTRMWTGAAPADDALAQSLNVAAIHNLREYGVGKFLNALRSSGMNTLNQSERHYGLSLIVGGAEVTAWDLAGVYSAMAYDINTFATRSPTATASSPYHINYTNAVETSDEFTSISSTGAAYVTMQAMTKVQRPALAGNWQAFDASRMVAWKTGTSYGLRDAWSVGVTPEYVVVVWAGNAAGEGRAGLTGYGVAAPLLFSVLNLLPSTSWFEFPAGNVREVTTCRSSGHIASGTCKDSRVVFTSLMAKELTPCSNCRVQFVDPSSGNRVLSNSATFVRAVPDTTFVLPPTVAWFYRQNHPGYKGLSPLASNSESPQSELQFVYPDNNDIIHLPKDFDGERKPAIAKVVASATSNYVYWHLNDVCIGVTESNHEMPLLVAPGDYMLTVVDEHGTKESVSIEVRH